MSPDKTLVFDLDGVVTDVSTYRPDPDVLNAIAGDLEEGLPVAFITGRALIWIEKNIMPELLKKCTEAALSNLVIITEKGAITTTRNDGKFTSEVDKSFVLPDIFKKEAQALLDKQHKDRKRKDLMFWDDTKQIIVTFEKRPEISRADFDEAREGLAEELRSLLKKFGLSEFRVDMTTLGTDVEHRDAGKHKGAQDVLDWLDGRGYKSRSFAVFGDSPSDSLIARTFGTKGFETTFVFVGDPQRIDASAPEPFKTIVTGGGFSHDTARYLRESLGN